MIKNLTTSFLIFAMILVGLLVKAGAGPDQRVCSYNKVTMAATGTGTWVALPNNPDITTIWNPSSPTSQIGPFYADGTYGFTWGGDTVYITEPPVIYTDALTLIGSCLGHDSILAWDAAGNDSILWMINGLTIAETVAADSFFVPTVPGIYEALPFTGSSYHECPYFYGDSVTVSLCSCSAYDSIQYSIDSSGQYRFSATSSGISNPAYYWYTSFTPVSFTTDTATYIIPPNVDAAIILNMSDSVSGCTAIDTIYISTVTGINNPAVEERMRLYPNPNNGSFFLQTGNGVGKQYMVYDLEGRLVAAQRIIEPVQKVNLKNLQAGSYTLKISDSPGSFLHIIIIKQD